MEPAALPSSGTGAPHHRDRRGSSMSWSRDSFNSRDPATTAPTAPSVQSSFASAASPVAPPPRGIGIRCSAAERELRLLHGLARSTPRAALAGDVYLYTAHGWILGKLVLALDKSVYWSRTLDVEISLQMSRVQRSKPLCPLAADYERNVFEVTLSSVGFSAAVRDLHDEAPGTGPSLWFKAGTREGCLEWAEAFDDTSMAAADVKAGRDATWWKSDQRFQVIPYASPEEGHGPPCACLRSEASLVRHYSGIERVACEAADASSESSSSSSSSGDGGSEIIDDDTTDCHCSLQSSPDAMFDMDDGRISP